MRPRAALIEATDRRRELRPPRRGAQKEQLMQRQLAGEDIALGKPGDLLDIERRNHLPVQDLRLEPRCEALDCVHDRVAVCFLMSRRPPRSTLFPYTTLSDGQLV